jgi:hypothetical protein
MLGESFDISNMVEAIDYTKVDFEKIKPLIAALATHEKRQRDADRRNPDMPDPTSTTESCSSYSSTESLKPVCFAFQSGNCAKTNCNYLHEIDETLEIPKCKHFAEKGKCKRGKRCIYQH